MPHIPHTRGLPQPPPHPCEPKRKAPISAGAYSFDLSSISTPAKKPRTAISGLGTLFTPLRKPATPVAPPSSYRSKVKTPHAPLSRAPPAPPAPPIATPLKQTKPLGALPSPFTLDRTPARPVKTPDANHRPLQSILDDASPFVARTSKAAPALRDGEKLTRIGELVTGKVDATAKERVKREDEGVGVSPRKPRAVKWNGKGEKPMSAQLAQFIHTANSSLVLFYNSIQRVLHPPPRPAKPILGGRGTSPEKTPTVLQHIRMADIRLRPISIAGTRMHNGIMLRCEVIKRKRRAEDDLLEGDDFVMDELGKAGDQILVVLQPVPHECARLGVDPKVVVGKMQERAEKEWEIGVWAPCSEMSLAMPSATKQDECQEDKPEQEKEEEEALEARPMTRVIIASRYLIGEV